MYKFCDLWRYIFIVIGNVSFRYYGKYYINFLLWIIMVYIGFYKMIIIFSIWISFYVDIWKVEFNVNESLFVCVFIIY